MSDSIRVDYSTVEELFASKTIQPKETEKIKKPTEVYGFTFLEYSLLQNLGGGFCSCDPLSPGFYELFMFAFAVGHQLSSSFCDLLDSFS